MAQQNSMKRPRQDAGSVAPCNAKLFQMAKDFAADGWISHAEAKELWEEARATGEVTADEVSTLLHTMQVFRYTQKAAAFLKPLLDRPKATTSYYRQIGGTRYDRELLDMAEAFVKDGQVSYSEAHMLWKAAQDGKGVTEIERRTLWYTLKTMKYTSKASTFMHAQLSKGEDRGSAKAGGQISAAPAPSGEQMSGASKEDAGADCPKQQPERVTVKWKWIKQPGSTFPAFPVVLPRKEHRFTLVMCHPMGCYSTFFLGPEGLVKDLLLNSRQIRNHCKILCPGARHIGWGKQWFRYRSNRGGTRRCHAEIISTRDLQCAVDFVSGVVASEVQKLGSADRVLLGGYSQGGCISLAVGLAQPFDLGLVISQRGMLMQQTMDRYTPKPSSAAEPSEIQPVAASSQTPPAEVASDQASAKSRSERSKKQVFTSAKPRVLLTAGALDDVYLLANQKEGKEWLVQHGCEVDFRAIETLDHYENSHEEHELIRQACLAAFSRAQKRPLIAGKK